MLRPAMRPVMRPVMRSVLGGARQCFAYNFDGVDDRGVSANRAINIEGDNTFEFWTPTAITPNVGIISQNIASPLASREFELGLSGSSNLQLVYGGANSALFTPAQGLKPATRYGLTLIGTTAQIFEGGLSGTLVRTATFTRGAAREPTAPTLIGCRGNGAGLFAGFFQGPQYDIRINGTLWEMGDRDQAIQLPTPTGLGAELADTSVAWLQVNTTLATQQGGVMTFDGVAGPQGIRQTGVSGLINNQTYLVEYEIFDYVSGGIRCILYGSSTNQVGITRNSNGVYREIVTIAGAGGSFTNSFYLQAFSNPCTLKVRNISFRPLGTCNPMTLVNTTSDRWQQVACRV